MKTLLTLVTSLALLGMCVGCGSTTDDDAAEADKPADNNAVAEESAGGDQFADLVLLSGNIRTMDAENPEAEALAVKGDRILVVGTNSAAQAHVGADTKVIELNGQLVLPGLIDCHGHYMSLGDSLMGLDLRPPPTWSAIVAMVAAAAEQAEPGEWIVGRGWHQEKWEQPPEPNVEGLPFHHALSAVSPDNPVLLIHVSGHGVMVNENALQQIGVVADTPDPEGGKIVRDSSGAATGMLRENAQELAREALAAYKAQRPAEVIEAELRQQVKLAADEAIVNGITTFHDMGETFATIDLFKKMADEGNLPVRLYVCIQEPAAVMEDKLAAYRMVGYGNNFLTVRSIGEKVLDGALGTHGGWLLEPYDDMPDSVGFNVTDVEDIKHSAQLAMEHGYQMAIQGIGDFAARQLFDIYENEFTQHPEVQDPRWRIEHCQVIHPDDMGRFAKLGVIASVRGVFATSDGPWVMTRLGEERTKERGYQYQRMFQSGATVINGTDPPVEDIDPIANFYYSVTRMMSNGEVFLPEQKMTRMQALETYTTNAAFAGFEEELKGSLTAGKLADITILSKDIITVPDEEILDTKVDFTIIGGKIIYDGAAGLD